MPDRVGRNVRTLFCNIRGLKANLDDLAHRASVEKPDLIVCVECDITGRRADCELDIIGYELLHRDDRRKKCGGHVVYRRSNSAVVVPKSFITSQKCSCHPESFWLKLPSSASNLYFCCTYRRPSANDSVFECLAEAVSKIQEIDKKSCFVFMGDYNAHHEEWLGSTCTDIHGEAALQFCYTLGLSQLVGESTHAGGGRLDLVMTDLAGVKVSVLPPIGSSDHSCIDINVKFPGLVLEKPIKRLIYLYQKADWNKFRDIIDRTDWNTVIGSKTTKPELSITKFTSVLQAAIRECVPSVVLKSDKRENNWYSNELSRLASLRKAAHDQWKSSPTSVNWDAFKCIRNEIVSKLRHARQKYNEHSVQKLNELSAGSRKWWSVIKNTIGKGNRERIPALFHEGKIFETRKDKATVLNDIFLSKMSTPSMEGLLDETTTLPYGLSYMNIKSSSVFKLLDGLDVTKAAGSDEIPSIALKEAAKELTPTITKLFKQCIQASCFPNCWKSALVCPIPKGVSPSEQATEYRPISLLPVISKVFERLVNERLLNYFEKSNYLPASQYGFRRQRSTTDALLAVSHDIHQALDNGGEARMIALDLSAAFDKVPHNALIHKLRMKGIFGPFLSLLNSFLINRVQQVVVDGAVSEQKSVLSGVPQGSVLGPSLFLIYMSDLPDILENPIYSFADDTTLVRIIRNVDERVEAGASIQRDLVSLSKWASRWKMVFNPKKTQLLTVSRRRSAIQDHPVLTFDDHPLCEERKVKVLGVIFDNKMSFSYHVRNIALRAAQRLGIIRRLSHFGHNITLNAYRAWIRPLMEYGSPVWGSAPQSYLKLLDKIQERTGFGMDFADLQHRRNIGALCVYRRYIVDCRYPISVNLAVSEQPARKTRATISRHSLHIVCPNAHTTQFARSFIPATTRMWNTLPQSVIDKCTIPQTFKEMINQSVSPTFPNC